MHVSPAAFQDLLPAYLLALARVAGIFTFVPIPGVKNGPEPARAFLALMVTMAAYPVWPSIDSATLRPGTLLAWMAAEASVGLAAGLAVGFVCDALLLAMQMTGMQAGYSFASTIDPSTQADSTVLLVLAHLTAGLMFFACGFDRAVVHALISSMPGAPHSAAVPGQAASDLLALGSTIFTTGIRLAAPVVALLLMLEIALAVASRLNAQLQLLTVSFPLKMLAGLASLAMTMPAMASLFFSQQKQAIPVILRLMGH